ncbi:hypothetical protein N7448_006104 [Penicillium atrosanguineum]|uniref:Uncharacterized protein n=1 Tax=Penicillium atrosanguineum TaxID=1132637 RepID=A0A9W9L260_9EURO|nr:uncharacterized protein N7443_009865 [Penicillium atrosanguineum]KAJ5131946.1 hypothetical protein N7448_006104 [Penicillium atrosanguineum]KAJ5289612.1 hypothetical protein N7443_009865 [Penicillium atrosanguineum]KAJ5307431.1 hypothetical protein N7476_008087 [Penicillium atrosanguineum]
MSLLSPRFAWAAIAVLALLPVALVYAHPIQESATATQVQPVTNIQPRDPRLIPDTEHYLADIFGLLGVEDPHTSETPSPTLASTDMTGKQDKPANVKTTGTPTSSATKTTITQPAMYTTNIRHGDTKAIENIQIGSGYTGGNKLQASDLPVIFDAVAKELDHRFRNMIDSSDERGLGDDTDSNKRVLESDPNSDDFAAELGFLG